LFIYFLDLLFDI
jgi:hypothetical protein